jgi:hypothetical protein
MTETEYLRKEIERENDVKPCIICGYRVAWTDRNEDDICEECQEEISEENDQENEDFEKS